MPTFETLYGVRPTSLAAGLFALLSVLTLGCSDDSSAVRAIQAKRQVRMQSEAQQDHLGEVFNLLQRFVELNPEKSRRQISFHLNRWSETTSTGPIASELDASATELLKTISHVLPTEKAIQHVTRGQFGVDDVNHVRDAFLFRQVANWIDQDSSDDPLLQPWLTSLATTKTPEAVAKLRVATRIFDWTIRNIAYEPLVLTDPAPPAPNFPMGMTFRGAGYRQSNYESLWRGTGDAWQRAGVFTQLCRQADILSAVLALPDSDTGELRPWCVGVHVDDDLYLFEPGLGTYIPGPNQIGIATLAEARNDASVVRRLTVAGFFEYELTKNNVQQCVALLNLTPDAVSPRMQRLERGLTGNRRLTLYADTVAMKEQLDAIVGIAGVRLWDMPLLAEVYRSTLQQAAERDPMLAFWDFIQRGLLDSENSSSQNLARGRWAHLLGKFMDDDEEGQQGARTLYLEQRAPEFEIEDLRIDVDLQNKYGIRRELGVAPEVYDRQVQQIQAMMRLGKRTATYWLSLVQYDDGRFDTAQNWFADRVLDKSQPSQWEPMARYNLARCYERLDQSSRAIELYKTSGEPQEHGNRIRARLLDRTTDEELQSDSN